MDGILMAFNEHDLVMVTRDLLGVDSGGARTETVNIPAGTKGTVHMGRWNAETQKFEYLVEFNDEETGMELIALASIAADDLRLV
jgi:hypothetical protein